MRAIRALGSPTAPVNSQGRGTPAGPQSEGLPSARAPGRPPPALSHEGQAPAAPQKGPPGRPLTLAGSTACCPGC